MRTLKELLAQAKEMNIVGRHDMTKVELEAKINETISAHKDVARARKAKKLANATRNVPYLFKFYFVDVERATEALANQKVAKQARTMVEAMIEAGYTNADSAVIGETIANAAKSRGMKTTIGSRELAAYYMPVMTQKLGVVFDRYAAM